MDLRPIIILFPILFSQTYGVRLNKLFQLLDGYKSDFKLRGYLHLGYEYAVFLRVPKPHDRYLVYELYEAKKINDLETSNPKILAVSKIPVQFLKEQLKTFREELYRAKFVDENVVPGTQVKTIREWQIDRAFDTNADGQVVLDDKPAFLRSKV